MESIVDRIRILCQENGTSITKIEKELGYANGTIGKWRTSKRKPPLEKVLAIAKRLQTTTEYLYDGNEKAPTPEGEREITMDDFTYAMHNESGGLTDDDKEWLLSMARRIAEDNRKRNQNPD